MTKILIEWDSDRIVDFVICRVFHLVILLFWFLLYTHLLSLEANLCFVILGYFNKNLLNFTNYGIVTLFLNYFKHTVSLADIHSNTDIFAILLSIQL